MAGDWIKMRGNLWDDPRVSKLCDLTDQGEAAIVGALYWLWAAADQHTEDGVMPGLTLRQIDRKTGVQGFGAALCDVGWLADHPEGVRIIKFEEHNGASAKRRCAEAQRKANARNVSASDADTTRTESGRGADEIRQVAELEIEKRREEQKKEDPPAARVPRTTRKCPASFVVTPDLAAWAASEAPGVPLDLETAKLRDHTFKNAISDWPGAWRNWMRRAFQDGRTKAHGQSFRERDEQAARAKAAAWSGGLLGNDINTIDMEQAHGLIENR